MKRTLKRVVFSVLALSLLGQSSAFGDNFVEAINQAEAPTYVAPVGSSNAVFTTPDGKIIAQYRGAGDDIAFGRILDGSPISQGWGPTVTNQGFDLGFELNFLGKSYSQIYPTTNGWISLSGADNDYGYTLENQLKALCDRMSSGCTNENPATGIAVFSGDLQNGFDLAHAKSSSFPAWGVYWGQANIDDKPVFAVTYYGTTECCMFSPTPVTERSYFQLVLQKVGTQGDFNAYFNYDYIGSAFNPWSQSNEVVAGYGSTSSKTDSTLADVYSIFENPILKTNASTVLPTVMNNSTVPGRFVLFMRSGRTFTDVQQLVAAGFTEDAGAPAPAPVGPTPDFIFMFDPQDKTSKARISKQGSQLTCSAGKYRFGLPGNEADIAYKGLTYRLFVDGNLVESTISDDSSVTWDISKLTTTGLATCSVSMTLMGATLVDTSDGNRNIGDNAVATKANQRSSTVLAHSKQLQDALAALSKARTQIRASFEKQRISINADHQAKMDQLKSSLAQGSIDSKAYAQGVRTLKAAYQEKLSAATTAYKGSLESNTRASSGAADANQSELLQALKAIDATYAQSLEDAGYGVVVP